MLTCVARQRMRSSALPFKIRAPSKTSLPVIVEKITVDRPIESESEQFSRTACSRMARLSRKARQSDTFVRHPRIPR